MGKNISRLYHKKLQKNRKLDSACYAALFWDHHDRFCFKTKTKINSLPEGGAAMLAVETEARCIDDGGFQAGKQREFICGRGFSLRSTGPTKNEKYVLFIRTRRLTPSCISPLWVRPLYSARILKSAARACRCLCASAKLDFREKTPFSRKNARFV